MKQDLIIVLCVGFVILLVLFGLIFLTGKKEESNLVPSDSLQEKEVLKNMRQPAVAGSFYPADPDSLKNMINNFLDNIEEPKKEGEILALILPHAGYEFSGPVASYGFKELAGKDIETVILIGNSHQERFDGISIYAEGYFETPLGEVKIDSSLAKKIISESEKISFKESAHQKEHSLEVEIPFLQQVLKNFKIVPILFGNSDKNDYEILAQAILKHIQGKNVLLIASSDMSHYPIYEDAKEADQKTINAILTGEVGELEKTINDLEGENIPEAVTFLCGEEAVKTIMLVTKDLNVKKIKLLNYANSGDVSGDKTRVVGYSAIGFFGEHRGNLLNKQEQAKLLEIARDSVESYIKTNKIPDFEVVEPMLKENLGAFVTLKRNGQLRGCIGRFEPNIPLYQVVFQMAIAAATEDKRFEPVQENELD